MENDNWHVARLKAEQDPRVLAKRHDLHNAYTCYLLSMQLATRLLERDQVEAGNKIIDRVFAVHAPQISILHDELSCIRLQVTNELMRKRVG